MGRFAASDVASKIIEVLAANDVEVPEDLQDLAKGSCKPLYSFSPFPSSPSLSSLVIIVILND